MQEVGATIKKIRKSKNLTQSELAREMEISRSYLSDIENGNKNPSITTTKKLAEKLGVSVSYLTTGVKMLSDLNNEDIKNAWQKIRDKLTNDWNERELYVKENLFELVERNLSFYEVHFLNNVLVFFNEEESENILFISVLLQKLNNDKSSHSKETYDDLINEFSDFLKRYLDIEKGD
ncbi:helix-turn-helix domain-containing protein [Staphylococcus pettenkoferi]|uniref:helix-turn-helix domain-containing protein n=1 Tax=Staphylococcus pettenkoferi TaxID=170573 RepID=UPI001559A523|nr:helix-turn-helix transcriptional regulator [Staphylococcus pettenkoferi]